VKPAAARRRSRHRRSGQALVEFAFIAPILLLLIFGIVDFGRGIYALNAVSNAARMGVRTAVINQVPSDVKTRAAGQATALGIDPTSSCLTSAGVCLSIEDSTGAWCATLIGPDLRSCVAKVTVKYTFTAITPVIGTILGPIPLTSTSVQALENLCTASCPIP